MENEEPTQKYSYASSRILIMFFRNRLRVLKSAKNVPKNDRTAKNGLKTN